MFFAGKRDLLKSPAGAWQDKTARPLAEAVRLADAAATAEHLPIGSALGRDHAAWHTQMMLRTVPVYRGGRRVEPKDLVAAEGIEVRREDFDHYLDWLRSMW
jgi:hypothetical protein